MPRRRGGKPAASKPRKPMPRKPPKIEVPETVYRRRPKHPKPPGPAESGQ